MRRLVVIVLIAIGCGGSSDDAPESDLLHNPVIATRGLADPAVIAHQGSYFLYPTGDSRGFDVYVSTDLREWRKGPRVLELDSPDVWAPDVLALPRFRRHRFYTVSPGPSCSLLPSFMNGGPGAEPPGFPISCLSSNAKGLW